MKLFFSLTRYQPYLSSTLFIILILELIVPTINDSAHKHYMKDSVYCKHHFFYWINAEK